MLLEVGLETVIELDRPVRQPGFLHRTIGCMKHDPFQGQVLY
jgi:hypothetical protein